MATPSWRWSRRHLHALPDTVPDDAAVAVIGTGRTAIGILETAELTVEDVVLVTAGAGGIGNLLVQAARNLGATVVGAAGGSSCSAGPPASRPGSTRTICTPVA